MRVLVTRPREDAERIGQPLRALGVSVVNEPLLVIVPMAGPAVDLDGVQAVLVTSTNGVRALAKAVETRSVPLYAVGDQSARAARDLGFTKVESASGDVQALARLAIAALKPAEGPLLHAAGSVHAGDLAGLLEAEGFRVRVAQLYDARPTAALSASVRDALASGAIDAGFFFSPRTARTFAEHVRKAGLPVPLPGVTGYALSPAVARELDPLLAGPARVAEAPTQEALLALFQADLKEGTLKPSESPTPAAPDQAEATETEAAADATRREDAPTTGCAPDAEPEATPASDDARASDDDEAVYAGSAGSGGDSTASGNSGTLSAREQDEHHILQRLGGWLLVLVVLVAVGFGSMPWWWHKVPQPFQGWLPDLPAAPEPPGVAVLRADVEALAGDVTALAGTVETATGHVDSLADRVEGAASAEAVADLRARLDALEARPIGVVPAGPPDSDGEGAPAAPAPMVPAVDPARVEALEGGLADLNERLAALDTRLAAVETDLAAGSEARAIGRLLAIGQLRRRVDSGAPYTDALKALETLGLPGGDTARQSFQAVADGAETGIPTLAELRRRYETVSRAAARRAVVPEGDGWFSDTVSSLMDSVTVRRKGEVIAGGTLDALAAAEARLGEGDLDGTVKVLETVTGDPARELSDWLTDARLRASVDTALSALTTAALERLGAAEKTE